MKYDSSAYSAYKSINVELSYMCIC